MDAVVLYVFNTVPGFVARAKEIVGEGSCYAQKARPPRLPLHTYRLTGSERCAAVLRQILPYLIIKRQKAESLFRLMVDKPFGRVAWTKSQAGRAHLSRRLRDHWSNPATGPAHRARIKLSMAKPEVRARLSDAARRQWRDPAVREKMTQGLRRAAKITKARK